jgi:dTMP kinase
VRALPFITFEGSEGCGKSTQVKRLESRLKRSGVPLTLTREPGGTPIGESIRELLQFAPESANMSPETELLLFEASRAQLVREIIEPALARGHCVISDRYFDSTTVYQGAARKLDCELVERMNRFAVGNCRPDITVVLEVDLKTARARMKEPRRPDRMEQETEEFYERVREGYLQLARNEPERILLIDGSRSPDEIEAGIWERLSQRFPSLLKNPK